MIPNTLYPPLQSGHPTSPCLLPFASQLLYQAACGFQRAPLLQKALQDCSREAARLCPGSRWPFLRLFSSYERDAKERDCDHRPLPCLPGATQGPERVSRFPKVSPEKPDVLPPMSPSPVTPGFFMDAPSSLSFLFILPLPVGSLPFQQGTEVSPSSALGWAREHAFKVKGVASTGLPRPRARPPRGAAAAGTVAGVITLAGTPLCTQSLDTTCCAANSAGRAESWRGGRSFRS